MEIKAKSNIKFRSSGQIISYKAGDTISPLHLHFLKTYYSGQIIEETQYTNPIVPLNKKSNKIANKFDDLKESLDITKNLLLSIKDKLETPDKITEKKTSIIEPVIPKEEIKSEGSFGEQVSKGSCIKSKIKKIRSLEKK